MVLKVLLFGDSKLHFETNKTLLMPATEFILSVEKLISVYFYGFMQAIENILWNRRQWLILNLQKW